ncbi:MAG: GNAT family N-acetyltransferase [Inconstantimicrobium porci]|nr:GNAT family N-acetyltransferase [Inconstantimicrobium porci]MDD6772295.1 GNAT family N-acetyltransferase [Inconstantimicrobium porci]
MEITKITDKNRNEINDFIKKQWFSTTMAIRGELFDMAVLPGFVCYENNEIIGLVTYRFDGKDCEVMSLDSLKENCGIGTALMNKVYEEAKKSGCKKLKLITTNDNLNAIKFYQKRGFDMTFIYVNAVKAARKIKPSIPEKGDYDIPIRHEIEFEKLI